MVERTFRFLGTGALLVGLAEAEAATDEELAGALRETLVRYRRVVPGMSGDDVIDLGCPPGPEVGAVLERLRAARLDGEVESNEAERALALELIGELGTPN